VSAVSGQRGRWRRWLAAEPTAGWAVGLLLTALAGWFHWEFFGHAGALWRDEVNMARLAELPTWGELWAMLSRDHCPALPLGLLRGWLALGGGESVVGFRLWGFGVGLLLVAALWTAARALRGGAPVLALALVAVNVPLLRSTDALRAYGLGSALAVLALVAIWWVVERRSGARVAVAVLAAVASVQTLYSNAFLLLAAGGAGMAVCARRREWRGVVAVAAVGLAAAASLLPYVPRVLEAQEWYVLEKFGFSFATGWRHIVGATGFPWPGLAWLWVGFAAAAVAAPLAVRVWRRTADPAQERVREVVLFGATALVVGLAGYAVFLKAAGLPTQQWYYLPPLAFAAVCLETVLASCHRWAARVLWAVALVCGLGAALTDHGALRLRQTNVDQVAARLECEAAPGDLIIVHPWYYGVSFARYYHGAAEWETLPPLADHSLHRYDLFKVRMQEEFPAQPVLERMVAALQGGHRVWVVGQLALSTELPPQLPPAPQSPYGWRDEPYSQCWGAQVGYVLATHARGGAVVIDPTGAEVNPFENLPLLVFGGWR
jgi:hypothetical protein